MHTVIVTGASRGLGEAVVRDLNRRGAAIVATARSTDALAALADELDNVVALAGDVSSDSHRRAVVEAALHRFGRIDALKPDSDRSDGNRIAINNPRHAAHWAPRCGEYGR